MPPMPPWQGQAQASEAGCQVPGHLENGLGRTACFEPLLRTDGLPLQDEVRLYREEKCRHCGRVGIYRQCLQNGGEMRDRFPRGGELPVGEQEPAVACVGVEPPAGRLLPDSGWSQSEPPPYLSGGEGRRVHLFLRDGICGHRFPDR